jgi:hypothetical protein
MPEELTDERIVELCLRRGTNTTAQLLVLSELTGKLIDEVTEVYDKHMSRVQSVLYSLRRE